MASYPFLFWNNNLKKIEELEELNLDEEKIILEEELDLDCLLKTDLADATSVEAREYNMLKDIVLHNCALYGAADQCNYVLGCILKQGMTKHIKKDSFMTRDIILSILQQ